MPKRFAEIAFTPHVRELQERAGSRRSYARRMTEGENETLGDDERLFIETRDSFYLGTVTEDGWPYIQHRGGPRGFLRVIDDRTIAFADLAGNKQYISAGNLATSDRAALFLIDYPSRTRLKLFAHAKIIERADDPAFVASLAVAGYNAGIERAIVFALEGFDWNCPQHITPRYTEEEVAAITAPLHDRIAALESALADAQRHAASVPPVPRHE
jgi:predicted pyridoxine 5'-phosphate oxidase superfamily flavin-nucleotide-binding protein